ncbi:MAG: acyltransferase family protein [Pseudomonadota bacterium]
MAHRPHLIHPQYRPDIDGLRAIAVLAVVGFHAFPSTVRGGFIGVDIFFVISGYLISTIIFSSLERTRFSLTEFYRRRILRIFPALLLVTLSSMIFGWFALFADEYKQLGKHMAGSAGFVSNFLLWGESGYFDTAGETKPFLHLWSLAVEEQFYVFWPVMLLLVWKRRWNFFAITLAIAGASFAASVYWVHKNPGAAFYSPFSRFWELMVGGTLAYLVLHNAPLTRRYPNIQSLTGAVLLAAGLALLNKDRAFPGGWALFPTLGTFLMISAGPQAWLNRVVLSRKALVGIGLISYPLYLWHWPLLSFARILENELPSRTIRQTAVLLAIVLAWATYRWVEKPLRFGRHGNIKAIGLAVLLAASGLTGYAVYLADGLPSRSAGQVTQINRFDYPFRQSCEAMTAEHYSDDWCNPGTGSLQAPGLLLVGDSFSNAYSTMLDAYAQREQPIMQFVQFGRGQCPMLLDYGPEYCRRLTQKFFVYLQAHPEVETIAMAAHWPAYYAGKDFWWLKYKEPAEAFPEAFEKTVHRYRSMGKRVVVLLAPPTGSNPKACVNRPVRISDRSRCDLTRALADKNDGLYRSYFIPKLAEEQIPYFDPFLYMCDTMRCRTMDGQRILSVDGGHLSAYGGEYLAEHGRARLHELLR